MTAGNIVILAGGISSRMKNQAAGALLLEGRLSREAQSKPKSMIGVGSGYRPFLDYLLHNVRAAGYQDVLIVVGENDELFREYYGKKERGNEFHGLTISYALQRFPEGRSKPLGTADALLQALLFRPDWRGQPLTVCNSDNLYSQNVLTRLRTTTHPNALIDYDWRSLEFDEERLLTFAVVKKDEDGFLLDIMEKPSAAEVERLKESGGRIGVSMNIFRFTYEHILPHLEKVPLHPERREKELPAAVRMMIQEHPRSVKTFPCTEYVPDLTYPADIPVIQKYLTKEFVGFSWQHAEEKQSSGSPRST